MEQSKARWTLGAKIVALFLVLGLSFSIAGYLALRLSVLPVFDEFERESSENAISRVRQTMQSELRELAVLNLEYSAWNETHSYAQGQNPDYAEENFDLDYWRSIDVELLLVFDAQGNRLYGALSNPVDGSSLILDDELIRPLTPTHPIVYHESTNHSYNGLLQTRSGPLQVSSYPILKTDQSGPVAGTFVLGRFLTQDRAMAFGNRATANVAIHLPGSENLLPGTAAAIQELLDSGHDQNREITDTSIIQYQLLRDAFNDPTVILKVKIPRRISQIGATAARTFMTFLVATGIIFLVSAWSFLQRLIVSPIHALREQMLSIRASGNLDVEIDTGRSDEVGLLGDEFSRLTSKLGQAQADSEKARLESEKARDEALTLSKTKSEFLARMSHEIRTPMNGVLGMTELLQDTRLDAKQQRFTQTIYESAELLLHIINDILDFSKMEAGKLRLENLDVDLNNILEETVDSLANSAYRKNLELICIAPLNLNTSVQLDPGRLRQVLTNLLSNAIKFTEKGEVVLKVSANDIDHDNVKVSFEIKDTGIGIRPEKQKDIFNSFTQEDGTTTRVYGGTGLGLSISKQLVDLMHGDLAVESTPGEGATFSFSLLLRKGTHGDSRRLAKPKFVAGARILIVDDNATNCEILEHQLNSWRACTDTAASATDALGILESAAASGDAHDLAILDMHMPHRDGMELARVIRDNPDLADLKLLILSSVATPASEDELADLEIAGQLSKPIRQSQLYDSLMMVLGGEMVARTHSDLDVSTIKALSGRVLLAEDNPVNQAVASGMMEAMGLSVIVVANGQEAIAKASREPIDVILMDCQMPEVDGFLATREIRRMESESGGARTPIIALTANALKGDREKCLAVGMDEYVTKPFTSDQLHSILSLYLQPAAAIESAEPATQTEAHVETGTISKLEPALDSKVLDGLSRLQQPGAPSILRRVIDLYLESSRQLQGRLREAVASADVTLLRESAHALKSSSANVGALSLAELCRRLEMMGRENDLSEVSAIHERFEKEFVRVVAALELQAESSVA
jgi:signal transduction histidine kinase/CheY-like chemotaxis protein